MNGNTIPTSGQGTLDRLAGNGGIAKANDNRGVDETFSSLDRIFLSLSFSLCISPPFSLFLLLLLAREQTHTA